MTLSRSIIAKIHIAKSQTGMDEDSYRAVLARYGVQSSKEMTARQANALLAEFKQKGFQPKKSKKSQGKPHNFDRLPEYITKIEALLADMGLPWSYADAIFKQQTKIERVAWAKNEKQLKALLVALDVEHEKRWLFSTADRLIAGLKALSREDIDIARIQATIDNYKKGWKQKAALFKNYLSKWWDWLEEQQ